ncbi:CBS and ACT domain-containing protein [Anaeromusa sp.]|jgi:acetoin utilization protein AcuB|uniref:CBS and ACT domain-containing protein n=1 Tax=Anaeromusa sp. TaxID=1872520 RepID=UPI00262E34F5|nr:CBS and ACT domain-containing protein [Anaeromusa sp.]MDD3158745.1 CBS and ACT domain-containing protein [Anaeromusa sp.]MEA4835922.1 CBS and ACT domain-containing protein [Anaeromusa sp.]NCB76638.1 CBS domain-containing protein [Negativicutes bacterium]
MFVKDQMTVNPVTVTSATTIADAAELMKKHRFRRLPVVDIGKLVGIVTDRDLRKASPSSATTLSVHEADYLLSKALIKDIMTKKVLSIGSEATIEEAALVMYNNRIGGVPVVDKNQDVVGIITETDIFKCLVDIMGLPSGTTRVTIRVPDKAGVITEITGIYADLGINITSMASYTLPDGSGEEVIRGDVKDVEELTKRIEAKGYKVVHVAQIG